MSGAAKSMAPAFQTVRKLLSENPRTFREILASATASSQSSPIDNPIQGATSKSSRKANAAASAKRKVLESRLPKNHEFQSATFLKKRVLETLSSQNLITKSRLIDSAQWVWKLSDPNDPTTYSKPSRKSASSPPSNPSTSSTNTSEDSGLETITPATSIEDPLRPKWDTEAHWQRILSDEPLASIAEDYKTFTQKLQKYTRDEAVRKGDIILEDRELQFSENRVPGFTLPMERTHLNPRRRKGRDQKEMERFAYVTQAERP